jgi:hypothetical protein
MKVIVTEGKKTELTYPRLMQNKKESSWICVTDGKRHWTIVSRPAAPSYVGKHAEDYDPSAWEDFTGELTLGN